MNFLLGSTGLVGSLLVQELKNNEETFLAINRRKVDYLSDDEQVVIDEIDNFNFLNLAKKLKKNGCHTLAIVSAVGANKSSNNYYLSIKGKLEEELLRMGFSKLIFARPGHLLGKREKQKDFGTHLIELFGKISDPFLIGKLKKFRNIQAKMVAELLIKVSSEEYKDDTYIIEFNKIKKLT